MNWCNWAIDFTLPAVSSIATIVLSAIFDIIKSASPAVVGGELILPIHNAHNKGCK